MPFTGKYDPVGAIRDLLDHSQMKSNPALMHEAAKTLLKEVDRLRAILDEKGMEY